MTNKHCASGLCNSNSRSHPNIKFAKFVQPGVDKGKSLSKFQKSMFLASSVTCVIGM